MLLGESARKGKCKMFDWVRRWWGEKEKNTSSPFKRSRARWERRVDESPSPNPSPVGRGGLYNVITLHFANGVKKDKEGRSGRVGWVIHLALECMALPSFSVWYPLTNPVLFLCREAETWEQCSQTIFCFCFGIDNYVEGIRVCMCVVQVLNKEV